MYLFCNFVNFVYPFVFLDGTLVSSTFKNTYLSEESSLKRTGKNKDFTLESQTWFILMHQYFLFFCLKKQPFF